MSCIRYQVENRAAVVTSSVGVEIDPCTSKKLSTIDLRLAFFDCTHQRRFPKRADTAASWRAVLPLSRMWILRSTPASSKSSTSYIIVAALGGLLKNERTACHRRAESLRPPQQKLHGRGTLQYTERRPPRGEKHLVYIAPCRARIKCSQPASRSALPPKSRRVKQSAAAAAPPSRASLRPSPQQPVEEIALCYSVLLAVPEAFPTAHA